ncbi:uncharacterized protein LOC134651430 [Cydia amplana]|uniref:uncharacterized protein LOC134651430 n=1 Tax=Cydia amplana TaxID=1869771 RepID=UPI002FE649A0
MAFYVWSIFIILYQTILCVFFTWLTLECKLAPEPAEPRELTLIKMLYLFEPGSCQRHYYYNYSVLVDNKRTLSNILWMETNWVAASFRNKMKLWVSLHICWLGLALLNVSLGRRPCGFYAILLPLTGIGITLLVVDLAHAALFMLDAVHTRTEGQIWDYIGTEHQIKIIPPLPQYVSVAEEADTSWVSLLFAYGSLRGIVQWIVNFWIVQDNYFDGLHYYRELGLQEANKRRNY